MYVPTYAHLMYSNEGLFLPVDATVFTLLSLTCVIQISPTWYIQPSKISAYRAYREWVSIFVKKRDTLLISRV